MKKIIASATLVVLLLGGVVIANEAGLVSAAPVNTTVNATVTDETAISGTTAVNMAGTIMSISGGSATGDATWTVVTGNTKGYNLTVQKNDVLKTGTGGADKQFNDFSTTSPKYTKEGLEHLDAGVEEFGFTVKSGVDTVSAFKDDGTSCGVGAGVGGNCWSAVPTGSTVTVANSTSATDNNGRATTVTFQARAAGTNALQAGNYSTTITATAASNP